MLGLTGGIATGKSNVSRLFKKWGVPVVDADEISKTLTQKKGKALPAILAAFGQDVFFSDGTLNRAVLGELIFKNPQKKKTLEEILHPLIQKEMEEQLTALKNEGTRVAVVDVPLLFESGMEGMADEIWMTDAPVMEQVARLQKRNGLTEGQALARINSQWPRDQKLGLVDQVIDTTGPKAETEAYVKALFSKRFYPLDEEAV